jgi:hypothetical protein
MVRPITAILIWLVVAGSARAANHYDIDDAGTLDPGQCQVEGWAGRFDADPSLNLAHVGYGCGVGPVELGFDVERGWAPDGHADIAGPHIKWTYFGRDPDARLSAAAYLAVDFDLTQGGRPGGQLLLPLSWNLVEPLWINFDLGYDWLPADGTRSSRVGLQADWALDGRLSLIVERFHDFGEWTSRAGLRWKLTPLTSLHLSVSKSDPGGVWGFVLGFQHEFKDP